MRKILTISIQATVMAILIQACSGKAETVSQETNKDVIPVSVVALSKTRISPSIQASGQLTTDDETYLSFKTGGIVRSISVKEGDPVRKGQVLAVLDLTEIRAQVAQARLSFDKAMRDANRVARLHRDSVATLEQFQNSQTGLEIAKRQLEAAEFNLSFSEIRSLSDGFVLRKFVSEGQVVSPGAPVLLTNGARQGKWIIRTGMSDREWSMVGLQDSAVVSIDAFPNQEFHAVVSRKSEGSDPATGSFAVELTILESTHHSFAAGMFGRAVIQPMRSVTAWTIPYDALMDGDAKEGYVFVTNDGKTAKKVNVTIAGISKNYVQVSAGLEKAQSLIVSGGAYLVDGGYIQIINKK